VIGLFEAFSFLFHTQRRLIDHFYSFSNQYVCYPYNIAIYNRERIAVGYHSTDDHPSSPLLRREVMECHVIWSRQPYFLNDDALATEPCNTRTTQSTVSRARPQSGLAPKTSFKSTFIFDTYSYIARFKISGWLSFTELLYPVQMHFRRSWCYAETWKGSNGAQTEPRLTVMQKKGGQSASP
jgi:hypothetical protein